LEVGSLRFRRRNVWVWVAFDLLVAPLTLSACSTINVDCSQALPTDTIVGRLTSREGSIATFLIQSVTPAANEPSSPSVPPALAPRQTVAVRYFSDDARYLRLGRRYR
jgi:hypothetical protein